MRPALLFFSMSLSLSVGCSDVVAPPADTAVDAGTDTATPDTGPADTDPADTDPADTGTPDTGTADADAGPDTGPPPFVCPLDGVRGSGTHRLFAQGHESPPRPDGSWPFLHVWPMGGGDAILCDDATFVVDTNMDGIWQPGEVPRNLGPPGLVHGEHFLIGVGSFVEFTITLCDDITGNVAFYIPNFDDAGNPAMGIPGSRALHQLIVVHRAGGETLIAETIDDEPGRSGYNPFIRVVSGVDPDVVPEMCCSFAAST